MRVHLPESGGMTMIENTFIDQFMPSSSGDFVKIYLYLLRLAQSGRNDVSIQDIADALNYTESDVKRAIGYWQKKSCLDLIDDPGEEAATSAASQASSGSKITEFRPAQKYSKEELRRVIFVAESYLGRPISPSEQETLVYFLSDLGMSIDLIDYLLDYCVSMNHTSFRYMQRVAVSWAEQGIYSVEQARREGSSARSEYFTIFRALGIRDHAPTPAEQEYMDRWMKEYTLPMDVILLACSRTVLQTGKARFPYADSILKSWSEQNVRTVHDVEALDRIHEKSASHPAQEASRARKAQKASTGRFLNFEPSGTDWNAVAESVMKVQDEQDRISQES